MARSKMALGAKYRPHLKHPFKNSDAELLVKLRALRQKRPRTEIINGKKIRAALGSRAENFWRFDLRKIHFAHRSSVSRYHRIINTKNRAHRFVPERERPIVKKR